jgi:hypothetical protein
VVHRSREGDSRAGIDLLVQHHAEVRTVSGGVASVEIPLLAKAARCATPGRENRASWEAREGAPDSSEAEEMTKEAVSEPQESPMGPAVARMQGAMNFFRNYLEKGGRGVE